jgi:hypothetical protein
MGRGGCESGREKGVRARAWSRASVSAPCEFAESVGREAPGDDSLAQAEGCKTGASADQLKMG